MTARCIALLLAASLAGCCASGVSCNAPASTGSVAWDGLGAPPTENAVSTDGAPITSGPGKLKKVRKVTAQADSEPQGRNRFEQDQAAEQAADVRLNRQLRICEAC
jgi:hypothetical protein